MGDIQLLFERQAAFPDLTPSSQTWRYIIRYNTVALTLPQANDRVVVSRHPSLELLQFLLIVELELPSRGRNHSSRCTESLSVLSDLEGVVLNLGFLELHLVERLALKLLIADVRIKEEGPGLTAALDGVWWLLMEGRQVMEDGIEVVDTDRLVADLDDARPQFVLEPLLVLWPGVHYEVFVELLLLAFNHVVFVILTPSSVSIPMLEVHPADVKKP